LEAPENQDRAVSAKFEITDAMTSAGAQFLVDSGVLRDERPYVTGALLSLVRDLLRHVGAAQCLSENRQQHPHRD
jgi:hypothetical protein